MNGDASSAQIGAFLLGISSLEIDAEILYTCVEVIKEKAYPIKTIKKEMADTCGTGGRWYRNI